MITIRGKGASAGIAAGPLCFYRRTERKLTRIEVSDVEAELRRFKDAQARAVEELGALAEKARVKAGEEGALLFGTHQMLAEDVNYDAAVERVIRAGTNAEAAVADASERFVRMFAAMDNAYMRARAADVRDVSNRIIDILTGTAAVVGVGSDVPAILAADEMAPSEIIQLERGKLLGLLLEGGSESSHAAILARTMGIPAVIGVGGQLWAEHAGREVMIDGETGEAFIEPNAETRERLARKHEDRGRTLAALAGLKGKENVTRDGRSIRVTCNIGSPEDVRAVLENDGAGVGLFRSEILYFGREGFPDEEYQFSVYKKVLSEMEGREVVIRTLDVGADKQLAYFGLPREENPALGNRALRICLNRPEIFRTQLRALYRASAFGNLSILLPMVTSVWEVREVKEYCERVKRELDAEGVAYSHSVRLGVMIETPAAAIISDRLAREVDFFSCGTNDLTQYTLACDRQDSGLERFFDPHHPAVLRLLKLVADNAHKYGIRVAVCGELGADLRLTETFLALGVDELSVLPGSVLPLRQRIRETDLAECRERVLKELTE